MNVCMMEGGGECVCVCGMEGAVVVCGIGVAKGGWERRMEEGEKEGPLNLRLQASTILYMQWPQ